jgi:thiamine-phosphate pyrophosphorylase
MNKQKIQYSLYLVTDSTLAKMSLPEVVKKAVAGGITCVQIREKSADTRKFIEIAAAIKNILAGSSVPLIINDRVDIALAVKADGVHLGQSDMPFEMARRICGSDMIIGISAESVNNAVEAERNGADYIAVSPVFSTPTKTNTAKPLGLDGIKNIKKLVKLPVIGIGGINLSNAASVIKSGADGIAVVSSIMATDDPEKAARELKAAIQLERIS